MRSSLALVFIAAFALGAPLDAQSVSGPGEASLLTSPTLARLRTRHGGGVVGVVTHGYRPVAGADGTATRVRHQQIAGSGFAVGGGFIVTTSDLLSGAERVEVVLAGRGSAGPHPVEARLVGLAPDVGVALLAIDEDEAVTPLSLTGGAALVHGQTVFALGASAFVTTASGAPDAYLPLVTATTVDAVAMPDGPGAATAWIQTRDAVEATACGGPMVDDSGALVGLTICPAGGSAGAGYAVPATVVALTVPHLRSFGHLHRARLGLATESVTPDLRAGLGLGDTPGLLVADVARGGPADLAGLRPGDLLTGIDGLQLGGLTIASFTGLLLALDDRDEVPVTIERGGRPRATVVTATVPDHECLRPALMDLSSQVVESLGIIGLPVQGRTAAATAAGYGRRRLPATRRRSTQRGSRAWRRHPCGQRRDRGHAGRADAPSGTGAP